jgi:hypothetical protein
MRREMLFSKSWRRHHERSGKGCGLIRIRCRRGNGGRTETKTVNGFVGQQPALEVEYKRYN